MNAPEAPPIAGARLIETLFPGHVAAIAALYGVLTPAEQELLGALSKKLGLWAAGSAGSAGTPVAVATETGTAGGAPGAADRDAAERGRA